MYLLLYTNDLSSKHSFESYKNAVWQTDPKIIPKPCITSSPWVWVGPADYEECHSYGEVMLSGKGKGNYADVIKGVNQKGNYPGRVWPSQVSL